MTPTQEKVKARILALWRETGQPIPLPPDDPRMVALVRLCARYADKTNNGDAKQ